MAGRARTHRLGWLGTGRMGSALVRRLLAGGCDVAVYNRTRAKAEPLAALGAKVVDSAAELADRDIVFATVGTPQDLLDAVLGAGRADLRRRRARRSWWTARPSRWRPRSRCASGWRPRAPTCWPRR